MQPDTDDTDDTDATDAIDRPARRPAPHKGQQTRAAILDAALGLASHVGLEGLSIGALAEMMQMSKSGVFAHFGSREELQISVVREYHARFETEVFFPAMGEARGLPRLRALFERWVRRVSVEIDSGCIYISGAVEFDDRPGPVRDALASMVRAWHDAMQRAIIFTSVSFKQETAQWLQLVTQALHASIQALNFSCDIKMLRGLFGKARQKPVWLTLQVSQYCP